MTVAPLTEAPPYPDREARPGGRWSDPHLVDDLLRMAAIERAVVHTSVGWVPKVPEVDDKLRLGSSVEAPLERAVALRQHALKLLELDEASLTVQRAVVEPLRSLDASSDPGDVVDGLLGDARSFLLNRYRAIAAQIDPLHDARLLVTVRSAIDELGSAPTREPGALSAALDAAWSAPCDAAAVRLDDVLWEPQDRVPVPARPAGRPRPEAGARAHLRHQSRLEDEDIAGELNDNVMAELCAMELMCRSSYEHPDLPWSFHRACAQHAADEARHAEIFRRLLAQRGLSEADAPQHGSNYEYAYEFPECEAGSKRELIWRLLILCTVLEALAIDKLPLEIATRDSLGQYDIARALDYVSTDELFHTSNGLRWTRRLCEEHHFDPVLERERVHGRFFGRQRDLRAEYLAADPERAAREIDILDRDPDGFSFESRTEVELRRRASFTDDECEQVDRWGYNPRKHPLLNEKV